MTAEEVMAEVRKDSVFYQESGGGLTISGGDPLQQFEFTRELLQLAAADGIGTCLETSGWGDVLHLEDLLPLVGLFLWDIKDTDVSRHEANTGVNPERILRNLRFIDRLGAVTRIRCVVLGELNLTESHIDGVAAIYKSLRNCQGVELLPYHPLGNSKAKRLGLVSADFSESWIPSPQAIDAARERLERKWNVPVFR
jgi:pyruvate formate lyase activating enzyme